MILMTPHKEEEEVVVAVVVVVVKLSMCLIKYHHAMKMCFLLN